MRSSRWVGQVFDWVRVTLKESQPITDELHPKSVFSKCLIVSGQGLRVDYLFSA
jgi:hypothetical protein